SSGSPQSATRAGTPGASPTNCGGQKLAVAPTPTCVRAPQRGRPQASRHRPVAPTLQGDRRAKRQTLLAATSAPWGKIPRSIRTLAQLALRKPPRIATTQNASPGHATPSPSENQNTPNAERIAPTPNFIQFSGTIVRG